MRFARLFTGILAVTMLLSLGCSSYQYKNRIERIPPKTRVGVLLMDFNTSGPGALSFVGGGGGDHIDYAASQNYIFNALISNQLIPVSLNMTDLWTSQYVWFKNTFSAKLKALAESENRSEVAISAPVPDMHFPTPPMFLDNLRGHLKAKRIDYVILISAATSFTSEHVKAIVIRVRDDVVVGSKYYERTKFQLSNLDDLYRLIAETIREFTTGGRP